MDPQFLHFTASHEWVHQEGDVATVGLSRFAVDQLTDLIMIDLPSVGSRVSAGKSFGEVESVKSVSDLYAPVTGEVIEVNKAVADDVLLLSRDPYDKGWLIKVKLDPQGAATEVFDGAAYEKKVADDGH